jgi:hypothetical protein
VSPADRRVLVTILVAVVALGLLPVAAFLGFGVWGWASEPAHQLDLPGTDWTFSQLGDDPAPAGPYALSFSEDANHATMVLACGSVPLWWAWDTDGAALNLGVDQPVPSPCQTPTGSDRSVLDAVVSTEGWRVDSDTRIRLDSTPPLTLERAGG